MHHFGSEATTSALRALPDLVSTGPNDGTGPPPRVNPGLTKWREMRCDEETEEPPQIKFGFRLEAPFERRARDPQREGSKPRTLTVRERA